MRIIVSGGGSAGHISPTLATSDALQLLAKQRGVPLELLYLGQTGGMEERIVAASGIPFSGIHSGKFRRDHFASAWAKIINPQTLKLNARDAIRTVQGVAGAIKVLKSYQPDAIFLKGGYVCLPIGLAAQLLKIPYVIHESDLEPGLTNRILSRWARRIAVGFPVENYQAFDRERLVFTGNPVRAEVLAARAADGMAEFKLQANVPVVLVTGGSQGAAEINDLVIAALPELLKECQIIHVTGEQEFQRLEFARSRHAPLADPERYHAYPFLLSTMPIAIAVSDIIVGRAGAGTIAESAALGKPTVLIPNTNMAGHQVRNARVVARAGAARVLEGERATPIALIREIRGLLGNEAAKQQLGEAIRRFGRPDAATALAEVILQEGLRAHGQVGDSSSAEPEEATS